VSGIRVLEINDLQKEAPNKFIYLVFDSLIDNCHLVEEAMPLR